MLFNEKIFLILLAILIFISFVPSQTCSTNPRSTEFLKSDLPGDTIQIPNVKGYFTNMSHLRKLLIFINLFTEVLLELLSTILPKNQKKSLLIPCKVIIWKNLLSLSKNRFISMVLNGKVMFLQNLKKELQINSYIKVKNSNQKLLSELFPFPFPKEFLSFSLLNLLFI